MIVGDFPDRYLNRELSWIDFNERVLALAEGPLLPLLERVRFLAIFATNLDEFYMVRAAGLQAQVEAGLVARAPDGLTPLEQLREIGERTRPLVERHAALFTEEVMPALAKEDIEILRWRHLDEKQRKEMGELFRQRIFPVLTPLAVDPAHPFPFISNLSLNLAVLVRDRNSPRTRFARVKVPPLLPRFVRSGLSEEVFVPLEDVIAANLGTLFRGMDVVAHHAFRVTRNADLAFDDDGAEDLLAALEQELGRRRLSPAVRLEVEEQMEGTILELLVRELEIDEAHVQRLPGPLDLSGLWEIYALDRPELKDEPLEPVLHPALSTLEEEEPSVLDAIRERDVLVHHPYHSFGASVQRFIEQAARDPDVLAIKQTLYRTSGESPIVDALIEAAEAGKQVVVIVEIKARFEERANINWARTLERAGCHVVYGLVGLKTHAKLALVVRREAGTLRRYVHVGTGNYNPTTARLYEDLGLLTADPQIGGEVSHVFNALTGFSRPLDHQRILVAPGELRDRVLLLIRRERDRAASGEPARIRMKLNALVDEAIIDALYEASAAGVEIDLLIRGICALRPGKPGLSEHIRVRSILGRFLEHSRILAFGEEDPVIYIGSADMMHRNLDRRVEVMVRVEDPAAKAHLAQVLDLAEADRRSSWRLSEHGNWAPPPSENGGIALQPELIRRITAPDA